MKTNANTKMEEIRALGTRSDQYTHTTGAPDSDREVFFLVKNRHAAEQLVSTLEDERKPEIRDIRAITAIEGGHRDVLEEPSSALPRPLKVTHFLDTICGVMLGVNVALLVGHWLPHPQYSASTIALLGLSAAVLIGALANRFFRDTHKACSLVGFLPELEKGRVLVFVRVKPKFKQFVLSLSSHLLKRRLLSSGELQSPQDSVTINSTL